MVDSSSEQLESDSESDGAQVEDGCGDKDGEPDGSVHTGQKLTFKPLKTNNRASKRLVARPERTSVDHFTTLRVRDVVHPHPHIPTHPHTHTRHTPTPTPTRTPTHSPTHTPTRTRTHPQSHTPYSPHTPTPPHPHTHSLWRSLESSAVAHAWADHGVRLKKVTKQRRAAPSKDRHGDPTAPAASGPSPVPVRARCTAHLRSTLTQCCATHDLDTNGRCPSHRDVDRFLPLDPQSMAPLYALGPGEAVLARFATSLVGLK